MRTEYCGLVDDRYIGREVTLFGWVHRRRDHGGVIFIDLRDREGIVQVVCDPDVPEMFQQAEALRSEFCVRIEGLVRPRPQGTANTALTSGGIEVLCRRLVVLNPSVPIPFQLDDDDLSETTRLTHRVLDLRRPAMQNNLRLRYRVAMAVRRYLDDKGFLDIETPMLTKSTPEVSPVLAVPCGRGRTRPSIRTQNSLRSASAWPKTAGRSGSQTICTMPSRSRRSMKITPP